MIHRVYSDLSTFRTVQLQSGTNVILAHASSDADERDSRNGLGKSSLIEIIHFCLGSDVRSGRGLGRQELNNINFSIEIDLYSRNTIVTRNTSQHGFVVLSGNFTGWPVQPKQDEETGSYTLGLKEWKTLLGHAMFGLPVADGQPKYSPSFRMLISYFARRGKDAFGRPFDYFRSQSTWQRQVANTFLLDLSWEHAREWQVLRDKADEIDRIKKAAKAGVISDLMGSIGELETVKHQLETHTESEQQELDSFQVHPQYKDIERETNSLTKEIHALSNKNLSDSKTVEYYEQTLRDEKSADVIDVEGIFKQSGIDFPERVNVHLQQVVEFHQQVVKNREEFLREEITRKNRAIEGRREKIQSFSDQRAKQLNILKQHKALDEYSRLQERHMQSVSKLDDVKKRLDLLKKFEEGKSALRIDKEELRQNTRRDYDDRVDARNRAIDLFNQNSQALYNRPGQLIVNIGDNGFDFKIEIDRADSEGIQLMEIFCFDLMLAQLWSPKDTSPGFLIHDSSIFADVDERQIAKAIELGAKASDECNFQYIMCLNSDKVPTNLFSDGFDFDSFVRVELKDDKPESGLFGFRF